MDFRRQESAFVKVISIGLSEYLMKCERKNIHTNVVVIKILSPHMNAIE